MALLGTFSVVVAANLRAGRRPPCNCFGQRSSSPIGRATLIRNGVLAVVAGTLLVRRVEVGAESLGSFQRFTTIQAVATVLGITVTAVFAFHSWLLVNLVLQNGRLLGRIEQLEFAASPEPVGTNTPVARAPTDQRHARRGPAIGSPAPRFGLNDVDGRTVTIDDLLADGRPPVLLFLEPRCSACVEMAVEINARGTTAPDRNLIALVNGERSVVAGQFSGPGFDAVLVDIDGAVGERYGVHGTPAAVLVLPDGRIASALAEGRAAASRLLGAVHTVGSDAPSFDPATFDPAIGETEMMTR